MQGPFRVFDYLAIESLTLIVNDSTAINHRRLVMYISKTGTVVISEIIIRAILRKYTSIKIISRSTAVTLFIKDVVGVAMQLKNKYIYSLNKTKQKKAKNRFPLFYNSGFAHSSRNCSRVCDFLTDRRQRVKLSSDCFSEWGTVLSGVP